MTACRKTIKIALLTKKNQLFSTRRCPQAQSIYNSTRLGCKAWEQTDWSFWLGKSKKSSHFSSLWWTKRDKHVFCCKLHLVFLQQINMLKDSFFPWSVILSKVSFYLCSVQSMWERARVDKGPTYETSRRIKMERHMGAVTPSIVKCSGWKVYSIVISLLNVRDIWVKMWVRSVLFVHFSTNKSIIICHLQTYVSRVEKWHFHGIYNLHVFS